MKSHKIWLATPSAEPRGAVMMQSDRKSETAFNHDHHHLRRQRRRVKSYISVSGQVDRFVRPMRNCIPSVWFLFGWSVLVRLIRSRKLSRLRALGRKRKSCAVGLYGFMLDLLICFGAKQKQIGTVKNHGIISSIEISTFFCQKKNLPLFLLLSLNWGKIHLKRRNI